MYYYYHKKHHGFTLVELLVVIAIVGVLFAIAIPSYDSYVLKTRRTYAKDALSQFAVQMERYYSNHYTYVGASLPYTSVPVGSSDIFYALTLDASTQNAFIIKATPKNAQTNDRCGTLSINQRGEKKVTSQTADNCW